jgi:hypothetical protein
MCCVALRVSVPGGVSANPLVAGRFKTSAWPLTLIVADFCNKIGTELTWCDVGYLVIIGGTADTVQTSSDDPI